MDALKPLFEYGWKYEDFLPEGQMGEDGTVSHAIERANGYICQSQGTIPHGSCRIDTHVLKLIRWFIPLTMLNGSKFSVEHEGEIVAGKICNGII